jgi:hypothetical protein
VSDTVWRLNDSFAILGIEGVLNMLYGEGWQELSRLHDLAVSCDAMVLKDVLDELCGSGGNLMACSRLFIGLRWPAPKL